MIQMLFEVLIEPGQTATVVEFSGPPEHFTLAQRVAQEDFGDR